MNRLWTTTAVLLAFAGCQRGQQVPVVRESTAMNTYVTITVYDTGIPAQVIDTSINAAFAEIDRIEAFATDYNDSSEIGRANAAAGRDSLIISEELVSLLRKALALGDSSGGAFDVTVGPLSRLWDFLAAQPRVPPPVEVRRAVELVGYRRVVLRDRTLFLPHRGMKLDLGAIGKGYAADRAADVLAERGVTRTIVDIGGNLAVRWDGTSGLDSTVATISVRHPRREGVLLGSFRCGAGGISTSGDYQRCFLEGGVRYHHILDPATGYPASGVVSVTVVAPTAVDADALSTLVFVLGRVKGMEYIRKTPGVEGFFVYEQGDSLLVDFSPGFKDDFVFSQTHD